MVTKIWDSPEVFNIQVDLPQNPLRSLNVYVITASGQNLIIDSGFNRQECSDALWSGIRELGLDLAKTSVFFTHLHSDHTGLAADFVERGCQIYMGRIDYEHLDGIIGGDHMRAVEALYRQEGFPEDILTRQDAENQGRRYRVKKMFPAVLVEDSSILTLAQAQRKHQMRMNIHTWCFSSP